MEGKFKMTGSLLPLVIMSDYFLIEGTTLDVIFSGKEQILLFNSALSGNRHICLSHTSGTDERGYLIIEKIGILAEIVNYKIIDDNNIQTTLKGKKRFSSNKYLFDQEILKIYLESDYDFFNVDDSLLESDYDRDKLKSIIKSFIFSLGIYKDLDKMEHLSDKDWINAMSANLPFPSYYRQKLIEAVDYNDRAALIADIILIDQPLSSLTSDRI